MPGVRKALEVRYNFFIRNCRTMKLVRFVFGTVSNVITHFSVILSNGKSCVNFKKITLGRVAFHFKGRYL